MQKSITVTVKNVYGNRLIYPVCDAGKLFVQLTGQKTFKPKDIDIIKSLGYDVNVQTPEL